MDLLGFKTIILGEDHLFSHNVMPYFTQDTEKNSHNDLNGFH